jgi:hypothetical protein
VVLWNMKSCSVMRETAVFSFSADFISRRRLEGFCHAGLPTL